MSMNEKGETGSVRVAAPVCDACGICREVCVSRAIRMGNIARIVASRCTGCGVCVEVCPTGAIVVVGDIRITGART